MWTTIIDKREIYEMRYTIAPDQIFVHFPIVRTSMESKFFAYEFRKLIQMNFVERNNCVLLLSKSSILYFFCLIVVNPPWRHCACNLSSALHENNVWLLWVNLWAPESCPGRTRHPCCTHHERGYNEPRIQQNQALPGRKENSFINSAVISSVSFLFGRMHANLWHTTAKTTTTATFTSATTTPTKLARQHNLPENIRRCIQCQCLRFILIFILTILMMRMTIMMIINDTKNITNWRTKWHFFRTFRRWIWTSRRRLSRSEGFNSTPFRKYSSPWK